VKHRVVKRIDAVEIFRVEHVLRAGTQQRLGAEIRLEQTQHGPQYRHAGQAELAAFVFQQFGEVFLEQGIKHQARRLANFRQT
jgi:hypothetical protein